MKKLIGIVLAALLLLSCMPLAALAADPAGYVTISITDNGDRDYLMAMGDLDEDEIEYAEPFGVIVPATQVPYYAGETVAEALVRLFEMNGITYNAWGTPAESTFYLTGITFTKDGVTVENFGEGSITPDDEYMYYFSGWMVKLNNWFTSSGIGNYAADDGDVIEMLYTCGMGADIGNDWSAACADITGINVDASYGTVSPAFSADVKEYTLTVGSDVDSVKLSVDNVYYGAEVTYSVGDATYKYMRAIPVTNGTVITVNSKYYTTDSNTGEKTLQDEDQITITVVKPEPEKPAEPESPVENAKDLLEMLKDGFTSFISFFKNLFARIADFFAGLANR